MCPCTSFGIFQFFFSMKRLSSKTFLYINPARAWIEVQHQLRSHRSWKCTQTVHCNTTLQTLAVLQCSSELYNFQVYFSNMTRSSIHFCPTFLQTTTFVVWSHLWFFRVLFCTSLSFFLWSDNPYFGQRTYWTYLVEKHIMWWFSLFKLFSCQDLLQPIVSSAATVHLHTAIKLKPQTLQHRLQLSLKSCLSCCTLSVGGWYSGMTPLYSLGNIAPLFFGKRNTFKVLSSQCGNTHLVFPSRLWPEEWSTIKSWGFSRNCQRIDGAALFLLSWCVDVAICVFLFFFKMCVKPQMRLYVCHQMRLYVCHQLRFFVCHQMRRWRNGARFARLPLLASLARFFNSQNENSCLKNILVWTLILV